jgi:hypothetical protein
VVPFGLTSAITTFMCLMNGVFSDYPELFSSWMIFLSTPRWRRSMKGQLVVIDVIDVNPWRSLEDPEM